MLQVTGHCRLICFITQVFLHQNAERFRMHHVTRNEQKLSPPFLAQQDVVRGGGLVVKMGAQPARK